MLDTTIIRIDIILIKCCRTCFGHADEMICAAARYIAEHIDVNKPLLVSLVLKDYEVETLKSVVAAVNHMKPL